MRAMVPAPIAILLWRAFALVCLVLGFVGMFIPVLPTVPFILLAAWAGGRGWPALERWLLAHPTLGPHVHRWREHGAVPRRAKWAASVMMALSAAIVLVSGAPLAVKVLVPLLMAGVATWLWRRPER